jgi:hypothetical protein
MTIKRGFLFGTVDLFLDGYFEKVSKVMGSLDVIAIFCISLASMLASELVSWFFVYSRESYKEGVLRINKLAKKYDLLKRSDPQSKKIQKYKTELKSLVKWFPSPSFPPLLKASLCNLGRPKKLFLFDDLSSCDPLVHIYTAVQQVRKKKKQKNKKF